MKSKLDQKKTVKRKSLKHEWFTDVKPTKKHKKAFRKAERQEGKKEISKESKS